LAVSLVICLPIICLVAYFRSLAFEFSSFHFHNIIVPFDFDWDRFEFWGLPDVYQPCAFCVNFAAVSRISRTSSKHLRKTRVGQTLSASVSRVCKCCCSSSPQRSATKVMPKANKKARTFTQEVSAEEAAKEKAGERLAKLKCREKVDNAMTACIDDARGDCRCHKACLSSAVSVFWFSTMLYTMINRKQLEMWLDNNNNTCYEMYKAKDLTNQIYQDLGSSQTCTFERRNRISPLHQGLSMVYFGVIGAIYMLSTRELVYPPDYWDVDENKLELVAKLFTFVVFVACWPYGWFVPFGMYAE
jgi:hypothetical protein